MRYVELRRHTDNDGDRLTFMSDDRPHAQIATRPPYPVCDEGGLEPGLSRGLWLIKWLPLVPHLIALVFQVPDTTPGAD